MKSILAGRLNASVAQLPYLVGKQAVETMKKVLAGEKAQEFTFALPLAPFSGKTLPACGRSAAGRRRLSAAAADVVAKQMRMRTIARIARVLARTRAARHPDRIGRSQRNLMPADLPRRQTTWQLRPVRASREKAIRITPGSWLASSSSVIFAPELEMSWTRQCRAANPPSSVIQACRDSNLRAARFLGRGMAHGGHTQFLPNEGL